MPVPEGGATSRWGAALLGAGVLWGFLAIAELVLATLGVVPLSQEAGLRAGYSTDVPLFVEGGSGNHVTSDAKLRFFNDQRFATDKPTDSRRVFCVGGSTTYGRPYDDATSFCASLRKLLAKAEPTRAFEVVNAGGISYGSERVLGVMNELVGYSPDAFIIYSGHNEFLERRTHSRSSAVPSAFRVADERLRGSRLYSALRRAIDPVKARVGRKGEVSTLLDQPVGLEAYIRDDALRDALIEVFRLNLSAMVETARRARAVPVLVVPASNISDCAPFKSEFSVAMSRDERSRLESLLDAGWQALDDDAPDEAQRRFAEVVARDPRHAGALYGLGRAERARGHEAAASKALRAARAEDVCPLRALEPIQAAVRGVAADSGVPLVDLPRLLAGAAEPVFGAGEFLDHVHPTPEVHGRLAFALVDALAQVDLVTPVPTFGEADRVAVAREIDAGVDPRRHGIALRNLAKVLSWSGKSEDAARAARQALELLVEDAECSFILGVAKAERGRFDDAIPHYERALALEPDYAKARNNLGVALARVERWEDAIAAYQRVLLDVPAHAGARFNLANALVHHGRVDAGVAHYRELLRDEPDDVDAHFNLARIYADRGDEEQAIHHYREVLARDAGAKDARAAVEELTTAP